MTHQINKVPIDCRDIRRKVGNNGDMGTCVIYAHRQAVCPALCGLQRREGIHTDTSSHAVSTSCSQLCKHWWLKLCEEMNPSFKAPNSSEPEFSFTSFSWIISIMNMWNNSYQPCVNVTWLWICTFYPHASRDMCITSQRCVLSHGYCSKVSYTGHSGLSHDSQHVSLFHSRGYIHTVLPMWIESLL